MSGLNPGCAADLHSIQFELKNIFGDDLHALGHLRAEADNVVPRKLVERLREFLQPAVVGELSVVDSGITADVELDGVGVGRLCFGAGQNLLFRGDLISAQTPYLQPNRRGEICARIARSRRRCAAFANRRGRGRIQRHPPVLRAMPRIRWHSCRYRAERSAVE